MSSDTQQTTNGVPDAVADFAAVMASYGSTWALCGGWAVDAWLGRTTRDHGDLDISIFQDDLPPFFEHLPGWQLVAHSPAGDAPVRWDGRHLDLPAHLHGRHGDLPLPDGPVLTIEQGFVLDVQVDRRAGEDFVFHPEPRITLPLSESVQESPWGVPAQTPELLLLFKAMNPRMRDKLDFAALSPLLSQDQRRWLREAICLLKHPWLEQLA